MKECKDKLNEKCPHFFEIRRKCTFWREHNMCTYDKCFEGYLKRVRGVSSEEIDELETIEGIEWG